MTQFQRAVEAAAKDMARRDHEKWHGPEIPYEGWEINSSQTYWLSQATAALKAVLP